MQEGIDGKFFLSLAGQRDWLSSIKDYTKLQADKLEESYFWDFGEDGQYDLTPEWLGSICEGLRDLENRSSKLLNGLEKIIKPGRDPDLAFFELIRSLNKAFEKFTGQNATAFTNSDKDDPDEQKTTEFQNFARARSIGFGVEVSPTFDKKIQKALTTRRN